MKPQLPAAEQGDRQDYQKDGEMNDFQPGDQIDIVFTDAPGQSARATVRRFLSDQQEGLSREAEDYVFFWLEISPERQDNLGQSWTIALRADWKYYLDGREVEIRKSSEPASAPRPLRNL